MFNAVPRFRFYLDFNFCSNLHLLNSLVPKNFTHDSPVSKRNFDPSYVLEFKVFSPVPIVQGGLYCRLNHT